MTDWQPPKSTYGLAHVGNPDAPTLNAIKAAKPKGWLVAQITSEIDRFAKSMCFEKRMTASACTEMAIHFVREKGQFTFQDVQAFLKSCMLGMYGKFVYGNTAELMQMWDGYVLERTAHAVRQSERRSAEIAQDQEQAHKEAELVRRGYLRLRQEAIDAMRKKRKKREDIEQRSDRRNELAQGWKHLAELCKARGMSEKRFCEILPLEAYMVDMQVARGKNGM